MERSDTTLTKTNGFKMSNSFEKVDKIRSSSETEHNIGTHKGH